MLASLRRFLHIVAAELLYYSGALSFWGWFRHRLLRKNKICVVGLHRVLSSEEHKRSNSLNGMVIHDVTYASLLAYIQRCFDVIPLDAFLLRTKEKSRGTKPACLITFDDGWRDTYSCAFPQLRKLGLPAVVFLATGSIGTRGGFWVEQIKKAWRAPSRRQHMLATLAEILHLCPTDSVEVEDIIERLKRMRAKERDAMLTRVLPGDGDIFWDDREDVDSMLTWEQAHEMGDAGIEIGAHTVTHPLLSYEDIPAIQSELTLSKLTIEERLGTRVRAFAYPNGDWNERVREEVVKAGYRLAFTTRPAWYDEHENPYIISRIVLHEGNITAREGKFSPAMLNLTLAGWV